MSDHAARMRQGLSLAARSTITKAKGVSGTGSGEDPDAQLQVCPSLLIVFPFFLMPSFALYVYTEVGRAHSQVEKQ